MRLTGCFLIIFSVLAAPASAEEKVTIEELNWLDNSYLEKQVERIDELGRSEFGTPVRGDKSDLELLQRIIYRGLVPKDDSLRLQALGVVLGNVMVAEFGLEWKKYSDRIGTSRAACIPGTQECVFPVTMLSRRMEVGLMPDVKRIYSEVQEMIKPFQPKLPYQVN